MWAPKTVKVVCEELESGFMIINKSDLTSDHVLYEEPDVEAEKVEAENGVGQESTSSSESDNQPLPSRAEMEKMAEELGVSFRANIGDEKLMDKINAELAKDK